MNSFCKHILPLTCCLTVFILLKNYSCSYGQSHKIDSLLKELKTTAADTGKVSLLNTIAREYNNISDYNKAIDFSTKALSIADKIKYQKGKADAYIIIGNGN